MERLAHWWADGRFDAPQEVPVPDIPLASTPTPVAESGGVVEANLKSDAKDQASGKKEMPPAKPRLEVANFSLMRAAQESRKRADDKEAGKKMQQEEELARRQAFEAQKAREAEAQKKREERQQEQERETATQLQKNSAKRPEDISAGAERKAAGPQRRLPCSGGKKPAISTKTTPASTSADRFTRRIKTIKPIPRDDKCVYWSLIYGLTELGHPEIGMFADADALRQELGRFLSVSAEASWEGTTLEEWVKLTEEVDLKDYLQSQQRLQAWGGSIEFVAASLRFSVSVRVWKGTSYLRPYEISRTAEFAGAADKYSLDLFWDNEVHYDLVVLEDE